MVDLFMPDLSVVMPKTALEVRASGGFLFFDIYLIFLLIYKGFMANPFAGPMANGRPYTVGVLGDLTNPVGLLY